MIEQIENPKKWYQDSILFKLGVIVIIILLLLIPSAWIQGLVIEREAVQTQVLSQVAHNWSDSQLVQGPVLLLPYKKRVTATNAANKVITHDVIETAYILPENLKVKANLKTELYRQGIYQVIVYNSLIALRGSFNQPELAKMGIDPTEVLYDKARLVFGISDLNGLKNNPLVNIAGRDYNPEPIYGKASPFTNALQAAFTWPQNGDINFSYTLNLKGSNALTFLHIGKTTDVELTSDWAKPAFTGRSLPDSRSITTKGSTLKWHMLYYDRPFPQQWTNDDTVLVGKKAAAEATFGLRLQVPVDEYRKVTRTNKYASLIIILTFVSLFLTELIRRQNIHVFNYILIGAAMVIYYTLLLSFSEQIGYNSAYLVSSAATIALISWFTASLLKNAKAAGLFAFILTVFYGFIFVIIQLEEYSLLVGSLALFIIVAALMYFSRKINWDNH